MITDKQIQQNLIAAIKHCGLSQSEIARRMNVTPQTISAYYNGVKMPSLETFAYLCKVLEVSADDILCLNN